MRAPDGLSALAADLKALPARDRRAILGALSAFERAEVAVLLEVSGQGERQDEPDFSAFSPWLAEHLKGAASENSKVTPATAGLLAEIAAAQAAKPAGEQGASGARRRTLAAAIAAWLLPASLLS
ncbi:MAG TPA: hypothetical protein VGB70_03790 [Allosphingosinicella sp.]|jgi:hypothetical protein